MAFLDYILYAFITSVVVLVDVFLILAMAYSFMSSAKVQFREMVKIFFDEQEKYLHKLAGDKIGPTMH